MATIANLAVNVVSNTGSFNRGMDSARNKLKTTGKSAGGFGGRLKGLAGPLAIAAAGFVALKKFIGAVSDAMQRLDREAKAAESLGMQVQELQGLAFAAQKAGLESEQFITIFSKMQKKVGEAALGTGESAKVFEQMGLSVDSLMKMSPDERLKAIADAIQKIEDPALQAAFATKLFEEEGLKLLPMLRGGSEAIEAQQQRLEELQGTLNNMDTQIVQDSNDAWTEFGKAIEGLWNQLAVMLAPVFELVAEILTDIVASTVQVIDAFNEWNLGTDKVTASLEKQNKAQEAALLQQQKQEKAEKEAAKAREALEKRGLSLAQSLRTPVEKYTDTIADLDMLLEKGVISWETYERAVAKANDELKKSDEFKKKEQKAFERQSVSVAMRGTSAALSAQQKSARVLEQIQAQNELELEESKRQSQLLDKIQKNTGSRNIVRI